MINFALFPGVTAFHCAALCIAEGGNTMPVARAMPCRMQVMKKMNKVFAFSFRDL